MHRMPGRILDLHRLEGAGAYLQIEPRHNHAGRREAVEQAGSEVKARRWSSHTPFHSGVDRLVAGLVELGGRPVDVGRKRQPAILLDSILRGQPRETYQPVSIGQDLHRLDPGAGAELDPLARLERGPGLAHGEPGVPGAGMNQEDFGCRTGGSLAEQAGVADLGGVQNQEVTRRNERRQLGEEGVHQRRCPNRGPLPQQAHPAWQHADPGGVSPVVSVPLAGRSGAEPGVCSLSDRSAAPGR